MGRQATMRSQVGRFALLALGLSPVMLGGPQKSPTPEAERAQQYAERQAKRAYEEAQRAHERAAPATTDRYYQRTMRLLEERQWEKAVEGFADVVRRGGRRADVALYWKAYAQHKRGLRQEALATVDELRKSFPNSRWLSDAKALELEVRQAAGQPVSPESEIDEDLKLMAINSLVHTEPDRAIPLLEKLLSSSNPPKLKERALFVLGQSPAPRAREILVQAARGGSNPDLQLKALQYLGTMTGKEVRQALAEVYSSTQDTEVKRVILQSFARAGEKDRLLAAAREEKLPELRREAIHQLGVAAAQDELVQLYGSESVLELKQQILHSLALAKNAEKLIEVARAEKDPTLRREAIRGLGMLGPKRAGEGLAGLYAAESDAGVRREVIRALGAHNNAKALIEIARKETDPGLKKEAVERLSHMRSKEVTDFMLEILNK